MTALAYPVEAVEVRPGAARLFVALRALRAAERASRFVPGVSDPWTAYARICLEQAEPHVRAERRSASYRRVVSAYARVGNIVQARALGVVA